MLIETYGSDESLIGSVSFSGGDYSLIPGEDSSYGLIEIPFSGTIMDALNAEADGSYLSIWLRTIYSDVTDHFSDRIKIFK